MANRRIALLAACALCACASPAVLADSPSQTSSQSAASSNQSSSDPSQSGVSSSKKKALHHIQVEEDEPPPPELAQAEALIEKRDYAGAELLLRKAVGEGTDAASQNYVAWFDLGFVENQLGKTDASIAAYRKAVVAKPDVFESNLNLGLQLAKTGQPDAEQFLRAATVLKPTSHVAEGQFRAWLSLGHVLEANRADDALAAYQQAAALQPKDPEPHLSAGQLLEKQNKFSEAEQEYKQALELGDTSDALTALANLYMHGRQFPQAAECLRKLVAAHPNDAGAHVQLGRVLAAEGKNEDALAELQTGAKLVPNDVSVQRDLADLYATTGKYDQAEASYRALLGAHPNDAALHRGLGDILVHEKKFADAQQEFVAAITLKPDLAEAYGDLAFAASENRNYPLTLKALDARARFLPDIPFTYFLRASAFDHLKDFKQAAANYHLFLNSANGKFPDQEWQAKHRLVAIEPKK